MLINTHCFQTIGYSYCKFKSVKRIHSAFFSFFSFFNCSLELEVSSLKSKLVPLLWLVTRAVNKSIQNLPKTAKQSLFYTECLSAKWRIALYRISMPVCRSFFSWDKKTFCFEGDFDQNIRRALALSQAILRTILQLHQFLSYHNQVFGELLNCSNREQYLHK